MHNRVATIRRLFGLLHKCNISDNLRKDWIREFTGTSYSSLKNLTDTQLVTFIDLVKSKLSYMMDIRIRKEKTVLALWYSISKIQPNLNWTDDKGNMNQQKFRTFLKKQTGYKYLNAIDYQQLLNLICMLNTIKNNYENKPKSISQ